MKDKPAVPPREIPITLRAMLAADNSALPSELRHLIHVLALHADNRTGRGLTGQAQLGLYMGRSARQIRRLWERLDALWKAKESPVAALREGRWHTSDRYTLVVAQGAPIRPASRSDIQKVNGTSAPVNGTSATVQPDMGVPLTQSQPVMGVLVSTQCGALQSDPHSVLNDKVSPGPRGADAPGPESRAAAPPSTAEISRLAAARFSDAWAVLPGEDRFATARRREGLRRIIRDEVRKRSGGN